MGNGFDTGLREYESMEDIFQICVNAYMTEHNKELKHYYGILSEEAENGDQEAIYYLAKWYSTFPIEYGKKRNRILKTGTSEKCLNELLEAYQHGHYCEANERQAAIYRERLAETSPERTKELFRNAYNTSGYSETIKWVELFEKNFRELDVYSDYTEALMHLCSIRWKARHDILKCTPEETEREVRKILDYWQKNIKDEDRAWLSQLRKTACIAASTAYVKKMQYAEAIEVVWIGKSLSLVSQVMEIFLRNAPDVVVENGCLRLWKEMGCEGYSKAALENANESLQKILENYQKRGTLPYARLIKMAQEAGCVGAEKYATKVQELLHDEAMLSQALEILGTSNYRSAIQELNRLSDKGIGEASYHIGLLYHQGTKVERDINKAKQYMKKAKEAGFKDAERLVKEWEK